MVKRLLFVLLLALAGSANAGYYVTLGERSNSSYFKSVGTSSPCYLTVSMAVYWMGGYGTALTSVDNTLGTWSAYYSQPGFTASGTFGACEGVPLGGGLAVMVGGVDDPGLVAGGVAVGGSSGACMEVITNAADAELIAGGFLLLLAIAFGLRQIRASLDSGHLSDEKH